MTIWWLALILAFLGAAGIAFIWLAVRLGRGAAAPARVGHAAPSSITAGAREDVDRIFNDEFREELRNRGRLHFEKVIDENAMFLQQDLRLTTAQLNEFMQDEIARKLKEEFAKYEESINDAKQMAIDSIQKTNMAIDEQRHSLSDQVQKEILAEKKQVLARFENNMADIVNHYVMAAIGNQIDLNDQLDYILGEFETNKKAIIEDILSGA